MSRRTVSLLVASLLLIGLVTVAFVVPMPYVVLAPGVTENTLGTHNGQPVVSVTGHRTYPTSGRLDLTTVSVTSPDYYPRLPEILSAWWSSRDLVLPRDVVYPPAQSISQVEHENQSEMLGSQRAAIVAGMAAAGYDAVDVTVVSVVKGAPADGVLRKGDVITAVDGRKVSSTEQVVRLVTQQTPGSRVTLLVRRDGRVQRVTLTTQPSPDNPQAARIGVALKDVYDPPFNVSIRLGENIGGPSAGLMFSLAVYDRLTPGKLTGGRIIAGTGTIDTLGRVGVIGGVQQKIDGAYASGARVFLVPSGDCSEALGADVAARMELVRVSTISGAIAALHDIAAGRDGVVPRCGAATS